MVGFGREWFSRAWNCPRGVRSFPVLAVVVSPCYYASIVELNELADAYNIVMGGFCMDYIFVPLCLLLAGVFLDAERKKKYDTAVILKGAASLCFVVLGFLLAGSSREAGLICVGLVLGCVADVLLNLRYVFPARGQLIFLVGILVFLSGHVLYLIAVMGMAASPWICVAAGVVLTALLMVWIFRQITAKPAFKIFGVVYIGAIVLLNVVACSNLVCSPSAFTAVFFAGSLLFLVSDIVLILNTFGKETRQSLRVMNIALYYVGQLLIALSLQFLG